MHMVREVEDKYELCSRLGVTHLIESDTASAAALKQLIPNIFLLGISTYVICPAEYICSMLLSFI